MKKSLSELFNLPIEEVRHNFNITQQFTWAVNRLKEVREELLARPDWFNNHADLKYIDDAIIHFQSNLDEWYSGINSGVRTKLGDEHYEKDIK